MLVDLMRRAQAMVRRKLQARTVHMMPDLVALAHHFSWASPQWAEPADGNCGSWTEELRA
jgi:hypothetical protein